jgi:hypothetical protein
MKIVSTNNTLPNTHKLAAQSTMTDPRFPNGELQAIAAALGSSFPAHLESGVQETMQKVATMPKLRVWADKSALSASVVRFLTHACGATLYSKLNAGRSPVFVRNNKTEDIGLAYDVAYSAHGVSDAQDETIRNACGVEGTNGVTVIEDDGKHFVAAIHVMALLPTGFVAAWPLVECTFGKDDDEEEPTNLMSAIIRTVTTSARKINADAFRAQYWNDAEGNIVVAGPHLTNTGKNMTVIGRLEGMEVARFDAIELCCEAHAEQHKESLMDAYRGQIANTLGLDAAQWAALEVDLVKSDTAVAETCTSRHVH